MNKIIHSEIQLKAIECDINTVFSTSRLVISHTVKIYTICNKQYTK